MKSAAERRDFPARLIWGANPVSREGERPRPVAFARTGKLVRTAARFDGALLCAHNEITAPGGRRPISENGNEKARGRSPGAG